MEQAGSDRYKVTVHRMHGCYFARAVELPGCVARGASEAQAVENLREVIRSFVRLRRALGNVRATVQLEITA